MPAQSQSQRGMIFARRNQYKTKAKTPNKWKWIWDEEWENKGKLPKKKNKNETVQNVVMESDIGFEENGKGSQYIDWIIGYLVDDYGISLSEADYLYDKYRDIVYDCFINDINPSECAEIVWVKGKENNESAMEKYRAKTINESIYGKRYISDHTEYKELEQKGNDNWPAPELWTRQIGEKAEFDLRGMGEEWKSSEDRKIANIAIKHDGDICTIIEQATFTEIGDPDFEYYDIQFENGDELYAVSGYHLFDI